MKDKYLERALFVVAGRHCGKSTQLRSMFRDVRLGTKGEIPKNRKLKDFHRLTNERFLYLRLSSPHELKESPRDFLRKTEFKINSAEPDWGKRWNFACALQAQAANKMPDVVETVQSFVEYFEPEDPCGVPEPGSTRGTSLGRGRVTSFAAAASHPIGRSVLDRRSRQNGQRTVAGRFFRFLRRLGAHGGVLYHHFSFRQKRRPCFFGDAVVAVLTVSKYLSFASRSLARPASISSWDHPPAHRTLPPRIQ